MSLLPQEGAVLATRSGRHPIIPIVFALALDPVGSGMVTSLARPGGNVTGLSLQSTDLDKQATRTLARGRSRSPQVGDYRKCELSRRHVENETKFRRRPAPSGSRSSRRKSDERRISGPHSRRSRATQKQFM